MAPTIYFWKNEQLHTYQGYNDTDSIRATQFMDCYAVDTSYTAANEVSKAGLSDLYAVDLTTPLAMGRFGIYNARSAWRHVPLEKFPPEFRTALLLLGIT